MKGVIAWFVKNHVAANLIMWVIVCGGIATIPTLTQELIPDIELEALTVSLRAVDERVAASRHEFGERDQAIRAARHVLDEVRADVIKRSAAVRSPWKK